MTLDEPYAPGFDNAEDAQEVMRASHAESHTPERVPHQWQPPQGRGGQSLLPVADAQFSRRLRELSDLVAAGEELPDKELRYLVCKGSLRLLESRRPASVASAVLAVERMSEASSEGRVRRARRDAGPVRMFHLPGQAPATPPPIPRA